MKNLLIVEDEPLLQELYKLALRPLGIFNLIIVSDPDSGIEAMRLHKVHILLSDKQCDVRHPNSDAGFRVIEEMHKVDPMVPTILATGKYKPGDETHCDFFLPKPFHLQELVDIIKLADERSSMAHAVAA